MVAFDVQDCDRPGTATVLLSSGLGGAATYWAPQLPVLRRHFRTITYDHAGTGRSAGILPDGYSIDDMAAEVLPVLDAAGVADCHFVGHALGGLVGLALARSAPARLRSLTVVNAWAKVDLHTLRCFEARLSLLRYAGVRAYVRAQPIFLYPAMWLAANEALLAKEDDHGVAGFQGEPNLLRRVEALRHFDARDDLADIDSPALVIATRDDMLVSASQSEHLAAHLPHGRLALLERGGHAVNVTAPEAFNDLLIPFLRDLG